MALASASFSLADDWNRKVELTFSGPVAIPAVHQPGWGVLPAGTYVFKVFSSLTDRHIVQIFNKDESTVIATVLAIPNQRLEPTDKVVITFREQAAGEPAALRAMFYPGRTSGEEFVYPKFQATEMAKVANAQVVSIPATVEEEAAMPEAPEVVAELEAAPLTPISPTGEELLTPPAPLEIAANEPAVLPQTASPLALAGLLGLLLIGAGLALRTAEKRIG
jgi:hypothetical protein